VSTNMTRGRHLLSAAFITAGLALLGAGTAGAAPFDPFGNEDCVNAGGHEIDCCVDNNGVFEPSTSPGAGQSPTTGGGGPGGSASTGACWDPGWKHPSGGAGPAGAQAPTVVTRPGVAPPSYAVGR
jgi:hypothetical protein